MDILYIHQSHFWIVNFKLTFFRFEEQAVVGIAPEQSPVYQHILYQYRNHHKHSRFGRPLSTGGFPGVNSGVLLLHFDRLRASSEYNYLLTPTAVKELVNKYSFKVNWNVISSAQL